MKAFNKKREPKHNCKARYDFCNDRYYLHDRMNTKKQQFEGYSYKLGFYKD